MDIKRFTDSNVFYIITGVVLALLINQGLALALGTELPLVAVESNSMVPTFSQGDILLLVGAQQQDIRVGDIIVYLPDGHTVPIVHRVIQINPDGSFQTKGDANTHQFPFELNVTARQIKGKEVFIVPYLGWVKIKAGEAAGWVLRLFGAVN